MMKSRIIVTDGRDQLHRRPPALSGDYFQPSELSFEQLIALATEYARLMRFYQLDLRAEGDWHQFFSADEAIFMASVLAIDTDKMLAQFEVRLQEQPVYGYWFRPDIQRPLEGGYRDRIDSPMLVARALNAWMKSVTSLHGQVGEEVRQLLQGILRGLKWEMRTLVASAPPSLMRVAGRVFTPHFIHLTDLDTAPVPEKMQDFSASEIRHNFHTLTQAIRMLQNGIRSLLPHSLLSGQHDPGTSLLIAFIQLFQQLQKRLNRFGDKRIDFYFQRVLGMQAQGQKADSAFLVIRPTAAARQIQIDAGTEFIAGVDADQHDIVYATGSASMLSDARVAAIHSLYFDRHFSHASGTNEVLGQSAPMFTTAGCYQRQFDLLQLDSDENEHEKLPPVPLMGAPKPGEQLHGGTTARFGFAVSSKALLMREGERTVRVLFQYRDPAESSSANDPGARKHPIEDSLKSIVEQLQSDAKRSSEQAGSIRMSDVFVKLFRSMFRIGLTTQDGWYQVSEYRPEYRALNLDLPEDCLSIEFVLPASVPPIISYQAALHGPGYETKLPLMRFEMTQNEYRYPYDILSQWILQDIRIEVDVKAVRRLVLYNQIGQLSALSPFMPFGPLPAVGSYLIIGCEEILYKQLRDLSIDVEWTGLPIGLGGFAAYYRTYDIPLRSSEVLASLSVLADGKWIRAGNAANLFRYEVNSDGSPSNLTSAENNISFLPTVQYYKPTGALPDPGAAAFGYTSSNMNGLFKLTLDSPEAALGHQEYPALLSRVLTHNAQQKKAVLMQPLPNPPYTPQISRIALNYKAVSTINFEKNRSAANQGDQESFIHLHPVGWQTMFSGDTKEISQIPAYNAMGNLFIGVEGKQLRGTLSLYFYLREDSLPMTHINDSGLAWWYLSGNRWRKLDANKILEDSTKGFMTSGIVLLQLPDDIDTDNTVMPAGKFWLSVSAEHGVERFCSLYSIYAQAIKVTWRADQGKKPDAIIPAMRITKSRRNIPGVDSIYQIRRSFDGKAAESAQQFRVRASERLRHKNRALTPADIELLILEQFPQVYKVKCFPSLCSEEDPKRRLRPGHILIVAIPYLNRDGHVNQKPTLSGFLIHEIEKFVRQYASPDASISVENPVYEEVQVRCTIKLTSQLNSGRLSEKINQALCDYLSPWNAKGINQHFGWILRQHDVVSFLLDLGYVEEVSGVSLLQIVPVGDRADRLYSLRDNATESIEKKSINPSYPWSIGVPMNQHWIVLTDKSEPKPPTPIGINELKVGSTFIIPARKKL
ncbi:hypothetical protein [Undibacterium terreum]|nr:hypothetical protein [Undibacterium terreum]